MSCCATVGPTLETALPAIRLFDAFPDARQRAAERVARVAPATRRFRSTRCCGHRSALPHPLDVAGARRATPSDIPAASALHQALFPSAYITEADLVRGLQATDCALFVATDDDGKPSGYLFVQDAPAEHEAYIDYVGVDTAQRGRGLGRALLDAAARWGALAAAATSR